LLADHEVPLMFEARRSFVAFVLVGSVMLWHGQADATDFYELQIYTVETAPQGHWMIELHSANVSSATGNESKRNLPLYQIHNTLE
jgi:hypothetical protein